MSRYHPDECEASVADALALFQLNGSSGEGVDAVRREATAVLQHLFRFRSARRTDQRGRAIAYTGGSLTVVDDDDILAPAPASGAAASSGAAPGAAPLEA